jgi:BlaI family penicillinase repressor
MLTDLRLHLLMETPRISDAEWEIMKVIWRRSPCSAHEIVSALPSARRWSAGTIKTLLNRLHSKGALRFEKFGKSYQYYPAVTEYQLRIAATQSFLDRVFDGALSPMIAHLVRSRRLSKTDLDELGRILKAGKK